MPLIQISPENIKAQANNVRKYKRDQENNMNKLRKLIYSLDESWKGEAQDAFVAKFRSMEGIYKKFSDILEQYAKLMDKAANELQSTDQTIRNRIRNI